jgi:hypothetical protein
MTLNSRHLRVLVDMPKKRILADLTKVLAERDQLRGCELLIRETRRLCAPATARESLLPDHRTTTDSTARR